MLLEGGGVRGGSFRLWWRGTKSVRGVSTEESVSLLREEQESNTARRAHEVADTGVVAICDSGAWGEVIESGEVVVGGRREVVY